MSPHTTSRRASSAAITAAILAVPLLTAVPALAAPCKGLTCNWSDKGGGGSGGTGGGGSGGNSGPVEPPPPEGLTANEAAGFVPVDGGGAPAAAAPTTLDWVAAAKSSAVLPMPVVHTAPDGKTYVQVRTSLWVEGFDVVQTRPIGGNGQLIQATARPESVTWNMGETQKVCDTAGSQDGKTCHYTYKRSSAGQPGGKYEITATITWNLTWTCEGPACNPQQGDLGTMTMTSQPAPLVVSEIQTNTGQ
ncbi:hypothetical protein ETD83_34245 [Actinomadura soli]|uniref:Uncharacterized protein n=1 Tax=Actinomadura soli TaxID=2508997 RepID=A0A5C4J4X2_9ACTN|nr:hypothetical protein [Actinomadura soli]TMQ90703.1 hypothetical protein ETD83_34245 [Actinomadura soli]